MKKLIFSAFTVVYLTGCAEDTTLTYCPSLKPCSIDLNGEVILLDESNVPVTKGLCRVGKISCTSEGLICEGVVLPEPETCDGLDNNCDGFIDNGMGHTLGDTCEVDSSGEISSGGDYVGQCSGGIVSCGDSGDLVCAGYMPPSPETCDDVDNDCNGLVDDYPTEEPDVECEANECFGDTPVCNSGSWICPMVGDIGEEICDGIDNDCDGLIDENTSEDPLFDSPFHYPADPQTVNVGECSIGVKKCISGIEVVEGLVTPQSESCDGLDNDCDGYVDESADGSPLHTPGNYSGPEGTEGVGICKASSFICDSSGEMATEHEVLPRQEDCTNGLDDDCDGLIDEWDGQFTPQSFGLVLDVSGSMSDYLNPLVTALCDWAAMGYLSGSKFSVMLVGWGDTYGWTSDQVLDVTGGFIEASEVCVALSDDGQTIKFTSHGSREYQYLGAQRTTENSWPEGLSRNIVVFSDEPAQDPQIHGWGSVLQEWENHCREHNYRTVNFVDDNHGDWGNLSNACGGSTYNLSVQPAIMLEHLTTEFFGGCN